MTKVSECMTREIDVVKPDQPIQEAAQFMLRSDAGAMPVCDGDQLIGMVTDRDIAVRAVAEGRGPDTPVRDAMSGDILFCFEDDDVEDVAIKMSDAQVRRFPVLSRDKKLVGIVSIGDLARSEKGEAAKVALDGVTDPGGEHNQSAQG
ncbi:MAG: CBS domain-containing protein [Allosphingosinicella sp.]|uniref:CBS domain-containing protein n=1 Tax=Allosphingosinicella sp. TaxID=2823234 RepID=UPI0039230250